MELETEIGTQNGTWNWTRKDLGELGKDLGEREGKTRTELCFLHHKEHDKLNLLTLIRRIIFKKVKNISSFESFSTPPPVIEDRLTRAVRAKIKIWMD